jgi:hypothetical protein
VAGRAGGTTDNAAGLAGPDLNQRLLHRQSFLTVPQQNKAPTYVQVTTYAQLDGRTIAS